jgi:hypothetical protein
MSEPRRLREESRDPLERALLEAGATYSGSAQTRAKTLAALGLAGSATLLAGGAVSATAASAGATSLTSIAKLTWAKVLVGVTLVGGGAAVPVGYYAWQRHDAALRTASASAPVRAADANTSPANPAAEVTLTRELVALDAARSTLARGDAQGALALLDQYARKNPGGRLAIEAEVLRIDALARSGRRDLATRRAEAFLKRYPNSVLAPRVRAHVR